MIPKKIKNHIPQSVKQKYYDAYKIWKKLRMGFLTRIVDKDKISQGEIPILTPNVEFNQNVWANQPKNKILPYKCNIKRSDYLLNQILKTKIKRDEQILEIGTNMGRNLNYLFEHGFSQLNGIEINKLAVIIMAKEYPKLRAKMLVGSAESMLKNIPDNSFALTFSMSVLMHINPRSHFIFKEIARVTKKFIITMEAENYYNPPSIFPRNYEKVFSSVGFEQILKTIPNSYEIFNTKSEYIVRIFKKIV